MSQKSAFGILHFRAFPLQMLFPWTANVNTPITKSSIKLFTIAFHFHLCLYSHCWQIKINLSVLIKFSHDAKFVRRGWRWKGVWCYSPVLARLASVINSWGCKFRSQIFRMFIFCTPQSSCVEVGSVLCSVFISQQLDFLQIFIWILIEIVTIRLMISLK